MDSRPKTWLPLAQAANVLGVHPATLRRWADNGDIPFMQTPGGHRRFAQEDLERVAAAKTAPSARSPMAGAFASQAIAHTRGALPMESQAHWQTVLDPSMREHHRRLGRTLLGLTLQYVVADDGNHLLDEARAVGRDYAAISRAAGMSLADALQAALFFRDRLLEAALALPDTTRVKPHDQGRLLLRINTLLNAVQLAAVEGFGET